MKIYLIDIDAALFYPFTLLRSIAALRLGAFTNIERWQKLLNHPVELLHQNGDETELDNIYINSQWAPTKETAAEILNLEVDKPLLINGQPIAIKTSNSNKALEFLKTIQPNALNAHFNFIQNIWDGINKLQDLIRLDEQLFFHNKDFEGFTESQFFSNTNAIYVDASAKLEQCFINANEGPVIIGKHVLIMDGAILRGPVVVCDDAVIKAGAKIYPGSVIGKRAVAGGEIKNAVLDNYSNKAHDGYLGDSYVGMWCNLGAGTCNSNVSNQASTIQIMHPNYKEVNTGIKAGALIGDYTRLAINSSINSGSVIGIANNIFKTGLLPKIINNFEWFGQQSTVYQLDKCIQHIQQWMQLKQQTLSPETQKKLEYLHQTIHRL